MTRSILLLCLVLVSISAGRAQAGAPRMLDVLSEIRAQAQTEAQTVVSRCGSGDVCGGRFGFYRLTYNRTATAVGVIINGMIQQLRRRSDPKRSLSFNYYLDDAAVHVSLLATSFDKLMVHVNGQSSGVEGSDLPGRIDAVQENLRTGFNALMRQYRISGTERRRQILAQLKGLSWQRFEEFRPIATAEQKDG